MLHFSKSPNLQANFALMGFVVLEKWSSHMENPIWLQDEPYNTQQTM
jgi:hypothetical protein